MEKIMKFVEEERMFKATNTGVSNEIKCCAGFVVTRVVSHVRVSTWGEIQGGIVPVKVMPCCRYNMAVGGGEIMVQFFDTRKFLCYPRWWWWLCNAATHPVF